MLAGITWRCLILSSSLWCICTGTSGAGVGGVVDRWGQFSLAGAASSLESTNELHALYGGRSSVCMRLDGRTLPLPLATGPRERNVPEIQSMYEVSFTKLSERYFKTSAWPPAEAVADLVDQDHVFCLLYKVRRAPDRAGMAPRTHSAALGCSRGAERSGRGTASCAGVAASQLGHGLQ